jgi:hypothetical protein
VSTVEQQAPSTASERAWRSGVTAGIAVFAAIQLGLALLMAVSPHRFYTAIGPFDAYNGHYIRDLATFYAATGIGLLLSLRRVSWRVPMLALMTIQYALHSVNHLIDIGNAHPAWEGYFDFFSLTLATVLLARLWRAASAAENRVGARHRTGDQTPAGVRGRSGGRGATLERESQGPTLEREP